MDITEVHTDTEGSSHFFKRSVIMEDETEFGYLSSPETNIKSLQFQNTLPHHEWDFQNSPDKMYVVLLSGALELEVSSGEKRRFTEGNVILFEDKSGQGHKLKTFENTQSSLIVHLN